MDLRTSMTRDVTVAPANLSVAEAWRLLQREKIRHLPVTEAGHLLGIVSDRDLLRVADAAPSGEIRFWEQTLSEIMTKDVVTCAPATTVVEAVRLMTEKKIDALPVVAKGRLVGLVTSTDLLLLLLEKAPAHPLPFEYRVAEVRAEA